MSTESKAASSNATFAAGCFWGVEDIFLNTPGVLKTTVGYTGGTTQNPTYETVCTGTTQHAEAVLIEFDPHRITYEALLDLFWRLHDPTTPNRQGPDIGTQYRSAIFYHSDEQKRQTEVSMHMLEKSARFKHPVVTQLLPATTFYPAEDYHQQYFKKRGISGCHVLRAH